MSARQDQGRGHGIPLTDEEREARHYELYNETTLPARGTGLGQLTVPSWLGENWKPLAIAGGVLLILYLNQESKPVRKKKAAAKNPRMVTLPDLGGASKPMKRIRVNPQGFCFFGTSTGSNPKVGNMTISAMNSKLGPMYNWSLPQGPLSIGGTCPGSTDWCKQFCYASTGQVAMHRSTYIDNHKDSLKADFADKMIGFLKGIQPGKKKLFRIHVSGDFYSIEYAQKWIKIAKELQPYGWDFYTYTRCWRISKFRNVLAQLNALPNLNIMASTDPVTGPPPAGWREAGVDGTWTKGSVMCISQSKGKTCATCQFCGPRYKKARGIYLLLHGVKGKAKIAAHKAMLRSAIQKGYHLAPGASAS